MNHTERHPLTSYAFAALVVGAAPLSWLLAFVLNPSFYGFFYISVILATWYGGLRAGMFAIGLSVILLEFLLLQTTWSPAHDATGLARILLFAIVAFLVGSLTF